MKNIHYTKNGVTHIQLKHGEMCMIDAEDLNKVNNAIKTYWYKSTKGYVRGGNPTLALHRLVMDTPKGLVVDHINHIKADNRKKNLKNCTISENSKNQLSQKELIELGVKEKPREPKYPNIEPMLKKEQVMELWGLDEETFKTYMDEGLPYIRLGKVLIRFYKKEVSYWIRKRERKNN